MSIFKKQGVNWIDYYINGYRKGEHIGPDKRLVETVLRKCKVEIAEGRFLEKQRPVTTTFDDLADAYLKWIGPNDEAGIPARKRSWRSHDLYAIGQLRAYFGGKRLTALTPVLVGYYRDWRQSTISRRKRPVSAATVNREIACLKRMFKAAHRGLIVLKGGVAKDKPLEVVALERERNAYDRVLSAVEFARLCDAAEDCLKRMLVMGYCTGMRKGEIRSLRWDQVDLKTGTIRLKSSDTKTDEWRVIPISQTLTSTLKAATRYVRCP